MPHRVAEIPQRLDGHRPDALLVLHHEHDLRRPPLRGGAYQAPGMPRGARPLAPGPARQVELDRGPVAHLRVDLEMSLRLLGEAIGLRQAETGAGWSRCARRTRGCCRSPGGAAAARRPAPREQREERPFGAAGGRLPSPRRSGRTRLDGRHRRANPVHLGKALTGPNGRQR